MSVKVQSVLAQNLVMLQHALMTQRFFGTRVEEHLEYLNIGAACEKVAETSFRPDSLQSTKTTERRDDFTDRGITIILVDLAPFTRENNTNLCWSLVTSITSSLTMIVITKWL